MMPMFKPKSALDLTLEGSIGSFRIGDASSPANRSIEVTFLETHVGFDPQVASNDKLLRHLAPVREIFDFQALGFDEIMQRDIDDARVSTELIPYLLDSGARGSVKFFPPIVIVVLPVQDQTTKPATRYPKVTKFDEQHPDYKQPFQFIRSGAVGSEAFEFEYPLYEGQPRHHDYVRLKLNTSKVKLVIIDGQHRAMALLALHRNLKDEWSDERRMPFRDYYAEWTRSRIAAFNLSDLQLPIVICTYPEIDTEYPGDLTIIEAARRMFLTLNKTARKVSNSRNLLLDDQDLVSHFMRNELDVIKQRDLHSQASLRIWNVELDQYGDKQKIDSPMACTGVTHFYYMIEHKLFDDEDVKGISARSGKFSRRRAEDATANLLSRLDGENLLGATVASSLRRDDYPKEAADKLAQSFHVRYGCHLISAYESFRPYEIHNQAALKTETSLRGHSNPQIRTILFEGQNIGRTFGTYRKHMLDLQKQAKDNHVQLPTEIQSIIDELNGTNRAVEETTEQFKALRLELYLDSCTDKSKLKTPAGAYSKNIRRPIDQLYDNIYFTVAFQAALICGFFQIMEIAEREAAERGEELMTREKAFAEYISCLNGFFVPQTVAKLKNLHRTFFSDVEGDKAEDWKTIPTTETFNEVIFRGEMKPDEWPKYRVVFLELWAPTDNRIKEVQSRELEHCRTQAIRSLYKKRTSDYCILHRKSEEDLEATDWDAIFKSTFDSFDGFLKNLGLPAANRWSQSMARQVLKNEAQEGEAPEAEEA